MNQVKMQSLNKLFEWIHPDTDLMSLIYELMCLCPDLDPVAPVSLHSLAPAAPITPPPPQH